MRTFHRALRRAGLPVRMTEGFNRRPRVVFPHALEVGVTSLDEAVEVELDSWVAPAEFARRLSEELPDDLPVTGVELAAPRRQSSVAIEARYDAELSDRDAERAGEALDAFLAAESWPIERRQHNGVVKAIDLRPHVISLAVEGRVLHLHMRLGLPRAARPREVLAALLECPVGELLGVPLTKTQTVLTTPS